MSFDVFLQRFEHGNGVDANPDTVRAVLGPHISQAEDGWAQLHTSDGTADVYGLDTATSLMVNHVSGTIVWEVLVELSTTAGLAILPVDCGTFVTSDDMAGHLPEGIPEPIRVISTGAELMRGIQQA